MWWDQQFNLRKDGDILERLWWPLISHHFPAYETFWIKHIVPLTNRIDPRIPRQREDWVSFRSDPQIAGELERMVMAQYSTFYFISRSALIISYEPHLYIEDAFIFLDLAQRNARSFLRIWRKELSAVLGLPESAFPNHNRLAKDRFAPEIREYRNVIEHAPKIGKPLKLSREFLPKRDYLAQAEWSWRYVQGLDDSCFEEGRALLCRLLETLSREISECWREVITAAEPKRGSTEYRKSFNLNDQDLIPGTQAN